MKYRFIFWMLLLIFGFGFSVLKAQSLVIRLNNGNENTELLNSVQKITFSANDLLLAFKSGSTDVYGLSTIQKLYFDTGTGTRDAQIKRENILSVVPNPAVNVITIGNFGKVKGILSIYRSDGALVLQQELNNGTETIDISGLQSGLYFIISNGSSAKFIRL